MAKKQETPKERWEREKQERLARFSKKNAEASVEETALTAEESKAAEISASEESKVPDTPVKKSGRKSIAKANGLKSTFLLDENTVFMTSFGPGSLAQAEKHIVGQQVQNIRNTFAARPLSTQTVAIQGVAGTANVSVPLANVNALHAKSAVERMYFGESFADNIHVQIAYNIMDIRKLFAVYANIICHTVDNMSRGYAPQSEDDTVNPVEADDFLGMFPTMAKMEESKTAYHLLQSRLVQVDAGKNELQIDLTAAEKLPENIKKRLGAALTEENLRTYIRDRLHFRQPRHLLNAARSYRSVLNLRDAAQYFPEAFTDSKGEFDTKKTYALLRILGILRQASFHEQRSTAAWLFRLDDNDDEDLKNALNRALDSRLNSINQGFVKQNAVCLGILFRLYPQAAREELANAYYRFIIRRDDKNTGFSVRKLREIILTFPDALFLTGQKYDSVRHKLYNLLDFAIYYYYLQHSQQADRFVESLRAALTEENKTTAYFVEAAALWKCIGHDILHIVVPEMNGPRIKELQKAGIRAMSVTVTDPESSPPFPRPCIASPCCWTARISTPSSALSSTSWRTLPPCWTC